jgi:HEAT repeat protein
MASDTHWGVTPRQSIDAECARRGRSAVVDGCVALVGGGSVDSGLLYALGGPGAAKFLDGSRHQDEYWLRVWGARGLLWTWDPSAADAIEAAMSDESWRVREMALKVVARHQIGDSLPDVVRLTKDPVPRVRAAASRALTRLAHSDA